ncbi:hypothetical protein [Maritimibacter dapengensis]|uniref:Hemolysin-type calcium-binding repeat-containing protein n=1 Tax=Maritimibacter dapengensis TaxID=2836868 RepID=A0ABS6SXR0_9RHOB|nr:hypothetical protein [Maritimibacter dapengensis]MBV7377753.1 hypothetical protein [Maritimibacter dapengensis]
MARITYGANNLGFWNPAGEYQNWYDVTRLDMSFLVLEFNPAKAGFSYDPNEQPYKIVFSFRDAEITVPTEGPRAGDDVFTDGTIANVRMFNDSGQLIWRAAGLNSDLSYFMNKWDDGGTWDAFQSIMSAPFTIVGANGNGRPPGDWTGDDIDTGYQRDIVNALQGDDFIKDYGGRDIYRGGGGWDTVSYEQWYYSPGHVDRGLNVNLTTGTIRGPDRNVDQVVGVEAVRGTFRKDIFVGNNADNGFMGFDGRDFFNGRGGSDWVAYDRDDRYGGFQGIFANLRRDFVTDGFNDRDVVMNIENVVGTNFDDVFLDTTGDNEFRGHDGEDVFYFKQGSDIARGGNGDDTFIYQTARFGDDLIEDFEVGSDVIRVGGAATFGDLDLSQDGSDTIVAWNGNTIRLWNVDHTDLDAEDFGYVIV